MTSVLIIFGTLLVSGGILLSVGLPSALVFFGGMLLIVSFLRSIDP